MRIPYTDEMKEMRKKIEPYRVVNGMKIELAEDTPEEIRELERKFSKLFDEQMELAESSM